MPALSVKQRRLMGLAEHNPGAVNPQNRDVLEMTHDQIHDFASTPDTDLPVQSSGKSKRAGFEGLKGKFHGKFKKDL